MHERENERGKEATREEALLQREKRRGKKNSAVENFSIVRIGKDEEKRAARIREKKRNILSLSLSDYYYNCLINYF